MKEQEKWSKVKSLPPNVEVSDQGHVRIYDDSEHYHEANYKTYNGIVSFNVNYKTVPVHRVVAEAFVPNPRKLTSVKHKNEDKTDNRAENLYWADNSDNLKNAKVWKSMIYCLETGITYGSLVSAEHITGVHQNLIVASIKEGVPMCGLTFTKIDSRDSSYTMNNDNVQYMEVSEMLETARKCKSIEEYNETIRNNIES